MTTLADVHTGDAHTAAHNTERHAINAIKDLSDPDLVAALSAKYAPLLFFPVSKYGAKGDGTTDDTGALNAAATAAAAAGAGMVLLDKVNGIYKITAAFNIPSYVGLMGIGSLNRTGLASSGHALSTIKLASSTACVVFGNPILDATHPGTTCYSAGAWDFDIDGNSSGNPIGALRFDGVNQIHARNIGVTDTAGHAVRIASGQNATYDDITVHNAGKTTTGDCFNITGGAGGNKFSRCYASGTSADGAHIRFTKTANIYDVYSGGPAHNKFDHCIFETLESTGALIKSEYGGPNVFDDTLMAGPDTATDPTKILASGAAVEMNNNAWLSFNDCHFVVVGNAFQILSSNSVAKVTGLSVMQTTLPLFKIVNCAPYVHFDQQPAVYVIPQPLLDLVGTGSRLRFQHDTNAGTRYYIPTTTDPNEAQISLLDSRKYGDTQAKFFITPLGTMAWGPGGSVFPPQILTRDANYGMIMSGGFRVDGRVSTQQGDVPFTGGSASLVMDASARKYWRWGFTGGGTPSVSVTNPQAGSEVSLQIINGASPITGITFAANMRFAGNTPPTPAQMPAMTVSTITWRYDSDWSIWVEVSRSLGVPIG